MVTLDHVSLSTRQDGIFHAVFHPPKPISHLEDDVSSTAVPRLEHESAAWDDVTQRLQFIRQDLPYVKPPPGFDRDLKYILSNPDTNRLLVDWFSNDTQKRQHVLLEAKLQSLWHSPIPCSKAANVLSQTLDLLISCQNQALNFLDQWLASRKEDSYLTQAVQALRAATLKRLQSHAVHSLPSSRLFKTLSFVLHASVCQILLFPDTDPIHNDNTRYLLHRLRVSGLGGDTGQRAFAHAMNAVVDSYVQSPAVKVDWIGRQSVIPRLRAWVRDTFVPVARECLQRLTDNANVVFFDGETTEWESAALEKLARQRLKYLFEYVSAWDHSVGAILDLKEYIHTVPEGKLLLANSFIQKMTRRILHVGVATAELLSMYISVIHTFKALDPRGVLLDKVAAPLRAYLRQRDDTVRIIAASFLADVDTNGTVTNPSDEICSDLAKEIALSEGEDANVDEKSLDWDDMSWVPDPIDAGPDYKKSKSDDIMSFMLTLFERNDFIQEVQSLLGERLLATETASSELDKEVRLVELFKTRFGPEGLQSCEVMLRDIVESRRINKTLRPANATGARAAVYRDPVPKPHLDKDPTFSTLILSSFFWPSLREDEFHAPGPISAMQKTYEADFERIKNLRKLHWLSALGRVTVELELGDRTVKVEAVQTWQASVVYAFDADDSSAASDGAVTKTIQELEDSLSMDELLVRNATAFWVSQRVLVESSTDTFTVLETLPTAEEERAAPAQVLAVPQSDAAISAVKSQDAVLRDNKDMYELFMVGMLTNGGAMDSVRVTMMMKMVVPGGYAFGEEETRWLLAGMVEQGRVVENGGTFAIRK